MSARAPVSGDQSIRDAFKKADIDPKFAYLQLGINFDNNKFVVLNYQQIDDANSENSIKSAAKACKEKEHTYFIIRDPLKEKQYSDSKENENDDSSNNPKSSSFMNLYVLIHFAPDLSPVKQRMMYAASRPSLKAFFGNSSFSEDYHCNSVDEVDKKAIVDKRTLHHNIDFRSDAEIEKEQANLETVPKSATSQVMQSLPIDIKESAKTGIENYMNESCKCVFLNLDASNKGIEGDEQKCESITDIKKLLKPDQPRYILFWYKDKKIFGYVCPDGADRKLKFTYSTVKNNVIEYCRAIKLDFFTKVEFSNLDELNEEYCNYHIFPVKEKKETFDMPKAPKSKRKSKNKKRKKINVDDL